MRASRTEHGGQAKAREDIMVRWPRRTFLAAACMTAALAAAGSWFYLSHRSDRVNTDIFGVAIGGYDPVAYFTLSRAVRGTSEYEYRWNGASWHFVSARHRDLFAADPDRYAPQYGGFCAAGLAMGGRWRADPEVWKIVDGKLFLNYSKSGLEQLAADPTKIIEQADRAWKASEPHG